MTDLRTAAQQALEALEAVQSQNMGPLIHPAKQALRAALAEEALQRLTDVQQEIEAAMQEPVPPIGKASTDVGVPVYVVKKAEPVQEPVAIADGTFNHDCPVGTLLYTPPPQRPAEPVQEPDDKAASIRWQLCLLAQTEEFSDDVRNQIGRGVWLIDRLCAALAEPQNPCNPSCAPGYCYCEPVQEPVAWRTFDGEGGYDYRTYEDNEDYAAEWAKRNPQHVGWVEPLYTAPPQQPAEPVQEPDS